MTTWIYISLILNIVVLVPIVVLMALKTKIVDGTWVGGFSTVSTSFGRLSPPRRMGDSNPRGLAPNQLSKLAP